MNAKVFINYRRQDTALYAARLYDRLTARFGKDQVFIDIDQIGPGEDFVEVINRKVGTCDVAIVVIGPHWLSATDASGKRRLDNEEDFVRMEIVAALQRNISVIPVLVGGAQMPRKEDLPEALGPLYRRNAIEVSEIRFRADVNLLIEAIQRPKHPTSIKRPRNVDVPRAAAILYGDWGTRKAFVIGLAFAVAGYSSFWLIAAMCALVVLVGINYMIVCRLYPDGGGVYASVRHRSEILSIVGAFLLIADYLVTAAISSLCAFAYLGVPHPEKFAAAAILVIGLLNLLGPKHTGGLAVLVSVPTALVVITLGIFSLPHLGQAIGHLQPLRGSFWHNWAAFVSIVLALSGVEAIANATGVMKLNPGTSDAQPSVTKTSTPALLIVMVEVCVFTALLGLAMQALSGLQIVNGDVNAPGAQGVRDYMLRYLGEIFVGAALGPGFGNAFAIAVSVVFGLLFFSAVNTSIVALISVQLLLARDREIPEVFQRLNRWGVPTLAIVLATAVPILLVILIKDISRLAELYAVGVVGAIATNLGATATDRTRPIKRWERGFMFVTFLIMAAIEISLLVDKPNARYFVVTVLLAGLILRGLVHERSLMQPWRRFSQY
jgi:amino acid transporter